MIQAPFGAELAESPEGFLALWRTGADGVRVRVVLWNCPDATATIFLLPGRTEYVEKYGRVVCDLTEAGFAVAAIDWRGQGLSDRISDDPRLGHVEAFSDYQIDFAELVAAAKDAGLPGKRYMIAHSMGGLIGLHALIEGTDFERAAFSAPMWDIQVPWKKRLMALVLPTLARLVGKHTAYVPGNSGANYLSEVDLNSNVFTSDHDHFAYMQKQTGEMRSVVIGGPSIHWFAEARKAAQKAAKAPRPKLPILTFLGSEETVVSSRAIYKMHHDWPSGELRLIEGARHELMMEVPPLRRRFLAETLAFFLETAQSK